MSNIPPQMKRLGKYLKTLRVGLGLNMHEVARQSNLTASYISKLERGDTFSSIGVKNLIAFSEVYKIPPVVILEKTGFVKKWSKHALPCLGAYLKIRYDFSPEQVRDMNTAFELMEKKYKK